MGKAGRFACIFTPMVLTIASLGLLVAVGLGSTNKNNDGLNNLYFIRANTSSINATNSNIDIPDNFLTKALLNNTSNTASTNTTVIKDFYHVGLWNYCSGDFKNNSKSFDDKNADNTDAVTNCTSRKAQFWFNPVEVWGLNQTEADAIFGKELNNGLKAYKSVAKWMYISYIVTIIATAVEVVVGFFALFSRWGSLATTIVSSISSLFLMSFALTSTILYSTLVGTFNHALTKYNIHGTVGHNMFVIIWLAVLLSWASGLFWLFSSCCCSGRSDRIKGYGDPSSGKKNKNGGFRGRNAPYNYERVESPFLGGNNQHPQPSYHQSPPNPQFQGVPMQSMGQKNTAYEPFRHEAV